MVLKTAEVRWFYMGIVPSRLLAWFVAPDDRVTSEPPRTDHYLLVKDTDALGIKYREGRIEVKQRLGSSRHVVFSEDTAGLVEQWQKWGFPLESAAEDCATLEALDAWVAVEKARWLRDYRIDSDGRISVLDVPDLSIPSCSVELADLRVGDQRAWTLAFEAVGPTGTLTHTLERVARQVLGTLGGYALRAADSYGYPRWLQITLM
ncbi:MAG: hypothetical protein JXC32_14610 [Anaerolineae bacterium]|nr:hypothetical protein [Anaerolineae bacterium]